MTKVTPVMVRDDLTPSVLEQAAENGWKAGLFNFGKAEGDNIDHFNPGLVQRPDGLWLIVRRGVFEDRLRFGKNNVWAFKLNPKDYGPLHGKMLKFPTTRDGEQFEDPRAVYHNGKTYVSCCNFVWLGKSWTGAHQIVGECDNDWNVKRRHDPPYGFNGSGIGLNTGHEKNWVWFFHDGKPHLLYNAAPWKVVEFNAVGFVPIQEYFGPTVKWDYGEIRGGTPPVLVDEVMWTFFHSSLPWQGKFRRYYVGAISFEAKPPFKPLMISPVPLLTGSQNGKWIQRKPACIFACGSVFMGDKWLVTCGVNDLQCSYFEIPHEDLLITSENL